MAYGTRLCLNKILILTTTGLCLGCLFVSIGHGYGSIKQFSFSKCNNDFKFSSIPFITSRVNRVHLPEVAVQILEDIDGIVGEMPRMGVSVILPTKDERFSLAAYEDISKMAPMGFNYDPIVLLSKELKDIIPPGVSQRMRNMYVVGEPEGISVILQAFYFVKSLSKYRNKVLLVNPHSLIDWEMFVDDRVEFTDQNVHCLAGKDETNDFGYCNSFSGLYPMELVDKILLYFSKDRFNSMESFQANDWYLWLKKQWNVDIIRVEGILSGLLSRYPEDLMGDMVRRDPRYQDMLEMDEATVRLELPDLTRRLYGANVDYTKEPTFSLKPSKICNGDNGVFMINSLISDLLRRQMYRWYFKNLNITDYFFLIGKVTNKGKIYEKDLLVEAATYHDIVQYDTYDGYNLLMHKMYASLTFVKVYCPYAKAMWKMDQDVIVNTSRFPVKNEKIPFGLTGSVIDFDKFNPITCHSHMWVGNPAVRAGIPYGYYALPWRSWPFASLPSYCSGPMYMIKMDAIKRIQKMIKTFNWYTDPSSVYVFGSLNEDSLITGTFREMAGYRDLDLLDYGKHGVNRQLPLNPHWPIEIFYSKFFREIAIEEFKALSWDEADINRVIAEYDKMEDLL